MLQLCYKLILLIDFLVARLYNVICRKEMNIIKAATIRFSDKLHKALKLYLLENDVSLQEYVINIIKKDIGFIEDEDQSDYLPKK